MLAACSAVAPASYSESPHGEPSRLTAESPSRITVPVRRYHAGARRYPVPDNAGYQAENSVQRSADRRRGGNDAHPDQPQAPPLSKIQPLARTRRPSSALALVAAVVLLIGIAFVIVRDARAGWRRSGRRALDATRLRARPGCRAAQAPREGQGRAASAQAQPLSCPVGSQSGSDLTALAEEVGGCRRCPRLVAWREQVARERRAAFANQEYWGRPLPGFGDPLARLLVLGLAPAAHGANRTGRMFTGDRSGDFLFAAVARRVRQPAGLDRSRRRPAPRDAWITAAVRCAPPANRPTPAEREECLPWSVRELALLGECAGRFAVLGAFAWDRCACAPRSWSRHTAAEHDRASAAARSLGGRPPHPDRLLSPEPAEHLHRPGSPSR